MSQTNQATFGTEDETEGGRSLGESESEELALLAESRRFTPAWVRPSDRQMDAEVAKRLGQKMVHHLQNIEAVTSVWILVSSFGLTRPREPALTPAVGSGT